MRPLGKNVRGRGRGGRRGNSYGQINRHTTFDSNGPGVRLRGNALQLYEKYVSLGNEAAAAGERITAEAHYQHADHYFRVHHAILGGGADDRRRPMPHAATTPSATPTPTPTTNSPAAATSTDVASEVAKESPSTEDGKMGNGLADSDKTD